MTEFLVEISLSGTESVNPADLDRLRRAETVRAGELAAGGTLIRLWRTTEPGWRNVGLWRAPSEEALRETIATLPLASFMTVTCRPLLAHPNDPANDPV